MAIGPATGELCLPPPPPPSLPFFSLTHAGEHGYTCPGKGASRKSPASLSHAGEQTREWEISFVSRLQHPFPFRTHCKSPTSRRLDAFARLTDDKARKADTILTTG
jgi:hypothetical protein